MITGINVIWMHEKSKSKYKIFGHFYERAGILRPWLFFYSEHERFFLFLFLIIASRQVSQLASSGTRLSSHLLHFPSWKRHIGGETASAPLKY